MRSCSRCLENNWSFNKIEGIIVAICNNCEFEIQFPARKSCPVCWTDDWISKKFTLICLKCGYEKLKPKSKKQKKQKSLDTL